MDYNRLEQAVERAVYSFEDQVQRLHNLASKLEGKVAPFLYEGIEPSSAKELSHPVLPTKLSRDLEEVITHFESIIGRIEA